MTDITEQLAERTRLLHVAEDKIEQLRAEIDDLRARVAMLESDENEGAARRDCAACQGARHACAVGEAEVKPNP